MSRIAKKPIIIPEKTEVSFANGVFTVKGPLGELKKNFRNDVKIDINGKEVQFSKARDTIQSLEMTGTYVAHVRNMIAGVHKPYQVQLIIEGIGYKADVKGTELVLNVGFSHPVHLNIPAGLKVATEKANINISGIDKEVVGQFAAVVRATKKPEPYLGKGIRYADEVIRRKQGKKAA